MKINHFNKGNYQKSRGASLIEALFVIGAISTLATLAYMVLTTVMPSSSENKLERQVAILNASATMYRINGGHFDPLATTTEIFQKLKTVSHAEEKDRVVGLAGSMVDPNLKAIPTDKEESTDTSISRVIWDHELQKFAITQKSSAGIKSFYLDSKGAADRTPGRESRLRGGAIEYAAEDDWVWDYDESAITTDGPDYIRGPGGSTEGPATPPPPTGPWSNVLSPPLISIPEGIYPITSYQLGVTLANPNLAGTSQIFYSINRGPLRSYKGEVLEFDPEESIAAIVKPLSKNWKRSIYSVAYYTASPVKLDPPLIHASAPQFDWDSNDTIYVTLENPNSSDVSDIEYTLDGSNWVAYKNKSIRISEEDYPGGITVSTRAIPTAEYYLISDIRSRKIGPAVATILSPPLISFSEPNFSEKVDKIKVTLSNPNPSGSSVIYYAITDPEEFRDESKSLKFKKYKNPFDVKEKSYKNGFAVIAYASAASPSYQDSIRAEKETGAITGDPENPPVTDPENFGLAGGHFDLDTSSFIANFYSGTTDAHVHAYDDKYNVTGADFFALKGDKLHNISDDVPPGLKFKIIVINPDLSPGGRLAINTVYDPKKPSTWIPVQDYANIPVEDLPVFSLGGVPNSIKLSTFGIYFEKNAIANNNLIPTNTGDVRDNVPGKNGEWRNGALTIQAVKMKDSVAPDFTTSMAVSSGGVHGAATKGLLWEALMFHHWDGDSYHEPGNGHQPTPANLDATIILADDEFINKGLSSLEAYAMHFNTDAGHLVNEDMTVKTGNPWLRLSDSYAGREILLPTGKLGDWGLFATNSDLPFTLQQLIDGSLPEDSLKEVAGVAPVYENQYHQLVGRRIVAVVHKSDIGYKENEANPLAELKGDRRGLLAFTVLGIEPASVLPESKPESLPVLRVRINRAIPLITPHALGTAPPPVVVGDPGSSDSNPAGGDSSFTGNTHGEFHDPTGNPIPLTNLSGSGLSNFFEWGTSADKSSLFFTGRSFENVAAGEQFALGTMEFYNSATSNGDETVHVEFDVNLNLDVPDLTETLGFAFDIFGTHDSDSNTAEQNADYITFGNASANFATEIEGQLYGLSLTFGDVTFNGFSTDDTFHAYEGTTASGIVYGSFYAIDPVDLADYFMP